MSGCCGSDGMTNLTGIQDVSQVKSGITISEKAAEKIRSFIEAEELSPEEYGIRLTIQGGGCSGFSYELVLDRPAEDDKVYEDHGARVMIDPGTMPYVDGSSFDYVESLNGSGFAIRNPNAKRACGCGNSFAV
jgi:iron-sulfur cluster assembly accessory protein